MWRQPLSPALHPAPRCQAAALQPPGVQLVRHQGGHTQKCPAHHSCPWACFNHSPMGGPGVGIITSPLGATRTGDQHEAWRDQGHLLGWPGPSPPQPLAGGEMEMGRAKRVGRAKGPAEVLLPKILVWAVRPVTRVPCIVLYTS